MQVSLDPELEKLVNEKISTGRYETPNDVICEALRLLQERDEIQAQQLEELRREIAVGLEQLKRGEGIPGEAVFEELRRMSQERRQKSS